MTRQLTDDRQEALGESRRRGGSLVLGWTLWGTNLALLLAFVAWIGGDGKFPEAAHAVSSKVHVTLGGINLIVDSGPQPGPRLPVLWTLIVTAIVTTLGIFVTLVVGAATHRRLRAWLAFTMLVAAWLTVLVSWREIAWQGQRLRLRAHLAELEPIAASLRSNWPTHDGDAPKLGAFMAYPQGNPRTLLMLTPSEPPSTTLTFSAIEREADGALRFELTGNEAGTWLEWHPAGSMPQGFKGGLEGEYDFRRAAPLGRGWYLVRYR